VRESRLSQRCVEAPIRPEAVSQAVRSRGRRPPDRPTSSPSTITDASPAPARRAGSRESPDDRALSQVSSQKLVDDHEPNDAGIDVGIRNSSSTSAGGSASAVIDRLAHPVRCLGRIEAARSRVQDPARRRYPSKRRPLALPTLRRHRSASTYALGCRPSRAERPDTRPPRSAFGLHRARTPSCFVRRLEAGDHIRAVDAYPGSRSRPPCPRVSAPASAPRQRRDRPTLVVADRMSGAPVTPAKWRLRETRLPTSRRRRRTRSPRRARPSALSPRETRRVGNVRRDREHRSRRRDSHRGFHQPRRMAAPHESTVAGAFHAAARRGPRYDGRSSLVSRAWKRTAWHRLVVPEIRVGPDAPLTVVDDRALVVRPQSEPWSEELEQFLFSEPLGPDGSPAPSAVVADHAPEVALGRKNLGHRSQVYLDEHRDRVALGLEDRLGHVAEVLAVRVQRQRSSLRTACGRGLGHAARSSRVCPGRKGQQERRQGPRGQRRRREEVQTLSNTASRLALIATLQKAVGIDVGHQTERRPVRSPRCRAPGRAGHARSSSIGRRSRQRRGRRDAAVGGRPRSTVCAATRRLIRSFGAPVAMLVP